MGWVMCEDIKLMFNINIASFLHSCKELNNLLLQHNKIKCIGKLQFKNLVPLDLISSSFGSTIVYPPANRVWYF